MHMQAVGRLGPCMRATATGGRDSACSRIGLLGLCLSCFFVILSTAR